MRDRSDLLLLPLLGLIGWLHRAALRLNLRNADDWFHVDVAAGMLAGEGVAWQRAVFGYGQTDTLRPTPWLLWMANVAAFEFDGAGYYATNLALHLGLVAGLWALVRSLGGTAAAAGVAGAAVGLNIGTGQGTYYLAARDDQLMTLLVVVLLVLWPRLRATPRGRWGAAGLYLLACLCKPPAVAALGLLWIVDRHHGRSPLRFLGPCLGLGALWAVAMAQQIGAGGRLVSQPPSLVAPLRALEILVSPGHALGIPSQTLLGGAVPWIAVAVGLGLGLARPEGRRLAGAGLGWLLCTLPIPLLYLAGQGADFTDSGRQMLLPSVGLALVAGASTLGRGGPVLAAGALALFVRGFLPVGSPFLERSEPAVDGFLDAVRAHDGPLRLAVQRPHASIVTLLTSGALDRLSGAEAPMVALQGAERAFRVVREPYGYGRLVEAEWPEGAWLAEAFGAPGEPARPWPTYTRWTPNDGGVGGVAQRWDFAAGAGGWGPWPPGDRGHLGLPRWRAGEGFVVDASLRMPEGEAASQLSLRDKPGVLRSPPLEIDPDEVCGLTLDLDATGLQAQRGRGAQLVPGGWFAMVAWGSHPEGLDLWRSAVVAPLGPEGRATVRLDRAAGWGGDEPVRRLAVLASNAPARVVVRSLALRWCGGEASTPP